MDITQLRAWAEKIRHEDTLTKHMGFEEEGAAILALLDQTQTLRAVLQDIMTENLIPAEYPLLMARARAALDGGGV